MHAEGMAKNTMFRGHTLCSRKSVAQDEIVLEAHRGFFKRLLLHFNLHRHLGVPGLHQKGNIHQLRETFVRAQCHTAVAVTLKSAA